MPRKFYPDFMRSGIRGEIFYGSVVGAWIGGRMFSVTQVTIPQKYFFL